MIARTMACRMYGENPYDVEATAGKIQRWWRRARGPGLANSFEPIESKGVMRRRGEGTTVEAPLCPISLDPIPIERCFKVYVTPTTQSS